LKFENDTYKPAAVQDSQVALFAFYQTKQNALHQYYLKFQDLVDAFDHYGAEVGINLSLIRHAAELHGGDIYVDDIDYGHPSFKMYLAAAKEQFLALQFLRGADRSNYGDLVIELDNDYAKGSYRYPATMAAAYTLLNRFKMRKVHDKQGVNPGNGNTNKSKGQKENSSDGDDDIHGVVFVNKEGKPIGKDVACYMQW
jgi:hypothetical protein